MTSQLIDKKMHKKQQKCEWLSDFVYQSPNFTQSPMNFVQSRNCNIYKLWIVHACKQTHTLAKGLWTTCKPVAKHLQMIFFGSKLLAKVFIHLQRVLRCQQSTCKALAKHLQSVCRVTCKPTKLQRVYIFFLRANQFAKGLHWSKRKLLFSSVELVKQSKTLLLE